MPADMARVSAKLEVAFDWLGYSLYTNEQGKQVEREAPAPAGGKVHFNWTIALLGLMLTGVWIALAIMLYRYDPPAKPGQATGPGEKIGGWLVLVAIGVSFNPFRALKELFEMLPVYSLDSWAAITSLDGAAYHPLWAPTLLFALAAQLAQVVFTVLTAVLFFQKRRLLPRVYIGLGVGSLLSALICVIGLSAIPGAENDAKEWARALPIVTMQILVWGAYFLRSKRVARTFVHINETAATRRRPGTPLPESAGSDA
ncbi:DUF2569 domain-containing protein [Chitinimonas arctica]|nr:DUF2569 domain-containing protein [Chitinimonas arctica]